MRMKNILKNNRWFLIPYLLILAICICFLCSNSKESIHLAINQHYSNFGDVFFRYLTYCGEFTVIGPVCLLLIFFSYRNALITAAATALAPLGTQFCKHVVWPVSPRPKVVFQDVQLHLVDGVHLHSSHSFPSGHATGAFALFCCLAIFAKKPYWKLFYLSIAVLTAYSRLYLSQHFLIDVTVGSFIGCLFAVLCAWWISQYRQSWLDKSFSFSALGGKN